MICCTQIGELNVAKVRFYNFLGAYNKAYKNKNIDEKDFNAFLKNLRDFFTELETIDKTNEELLKNIFNKHLLKHYQILLNENRIDLSIKKDNKTQVIFEFKSLNNKSEMLQADSEDVNKKALQEAIWYFYNQDSKEISYNIKNVVITDTEHLFFFNPKHFCNKDLEKICLQYKNNQVAYTNNTKILYDQIGEKIKGKNIQFDYAEFNLIQYKNKILNNSLNDNDKRQLQYLYKALHPDFLLREYSPKDSNELNAKFYNELLYILGLKEEGKNQKKIVASDVKGTLRDRIVYDLNCKKFDDVINLIIVWLNRLLFLKLFESQLIAFNDDNKLYAFLNFEKNPNFAKLNRLFFNVLGKPLSERAEHEIPYLNSSLFERTELEKRYGNISDLDSESTLSLYKSSILSKDKNYPKNPKLLKYLLDFLEAYNFSSNVFDKNDKKDIINSSVLGLIFEKLNGYKDGSFFTPAYITEYMAETSINNIILQKFNNAFTDKAPCETIEELKQLISYDVHKKECRDFYNKIIDSLKICDPAVGSGHFLVSVLNYIVALKSELGLLPVQNKIEIQNDSLLVYEQDGETQFEYKRNNQNSLIVQKSIFEEKRKIIENCLFGVDINPNSVQICCLRLWIELLKNTYYIDNTGEMQVLPNIDINIKCGNSLTSNIKFEIGKSIPSSLGKQITEEVNKYKKLVKDYKNSSDKEKKNDINNKIIAIYKKIEQGCFVQLQLTKDESIKYNLEQANAITKAKFNTMHGSLEWAIAFPEILDDNGIFQGFDLIIGNPPYGIKLENKEKEFYKNNYNCAKSIKGKQKGSTNTYVLFIERGLQLLKKHSNLFYIVPMSITSSDECVPIQNIMQQTCKKIKISSYQERPTQIFDSACLRVSIIELYNTIKYNPNKAKFICSSIENTKLQRKKKTDNPNEMMKSLKFINSIDFNLYGRYAKVGEKIDLDILAKLFNNEPLEKFCNDSGKPIYYRTTGGRYFKIITNHSTGSTQETSILIDDKLCLSIGCILSSTLFWYFLQIYTDGLHIKDYEIKNFPIPKLTDNDIKCLKQIYEQYSEEIDKNAKIHEAKSYNVATFKEYKISKSFDIIRQIDDIVCKLYRLTKEETNYIKNYEIEYRLRDTE